MKKNILLFYFSILTAYSCFSQVQVGASFDGLANSNSGKSVSLSSNGNVLAIGSSCDSQTLNNNVIIYQNNSGNWVQLGNTIFGETIYDQFGSSVALSADGLTVAVGAVKNGNGGFAAGSVRVFKLISGVWTQVGNAINGLSFEEIGFSLSISDNGTVVAIGSYTANSGTGKVRIFENNANVWSQIGVDLNGTAQFDYFGISISLSGDGSTIAVGAVNIDANGQDSGQVKVFKKFSQNWVQIGTNINGEAAFDNFGRGVSLSYNGTILAVGAPYNDGSFNSAGNVRVFQNLSRIWTQIGSDIDGESAFASDGWSVSLSNDGNILAIGGLYTSNNGTDSGKVRIYQNLGGSWSLRGENINGLAAGDLCGYSISLSDDGSKVAIASPGSPGGNNTGQVRVFDLGGILTTEEFTTQDDFSIYPNPSNDFVKINLSDKVNIEKIAIYSPEGKLLKTEKSDILSVKDLSKGNYYFEIITNKGKQTKKIIVN
jgi:Secretion system C-terminal sorting domain/FG-GAP repeat